MTYEIKNRGRLGNGPGDVQEIDILGRTVRLHDWGISWATDSRHKPKILGLFGLDEKAKMLNKNGYKMVVNESETAGADHDVSWEEASSYRALAARINYLAQDELHSVRS